MPVHIPQSNTKCVMILTIEGILSGWSQASESESYTIGGGFFFFFLKTQNLCYDIAKICPRVLEKAIKIKGSEASLT